MVSLKSLANYYNVGETFINVRLQLYESCIVNSLLYNMEAWTKQSKGELKRLEKIQASILCSLVDLPKSTPYIGILNELGIWRIEEKLIYRKLMLYNNIMNSDDRRLSKRIILEQEETEDLNGSFFGTVLEMAKKIGVTIEQLKLTKKASLKNLLKTKLNERMAKVAYLDIAGMTKLRFLTKPIKSIIRKDYIVKLKGSEATQALRSRLNMIPIYDNYHNNITLRRLCPHCEVEDDTTEHLVSCKVFHSTITEANLREEMNNETWKQTLEIINFNLEHR